MSRIVVLSAPQATGKTRYARELARALDCKMIVDDYDGSQPLYRGTLALTNVSPAELDIPAMCEVIEARSADEVMLIAQRGGA